MNQLPYWLQVLQALGTPAIALLALVIGAMQWRTAHQRATFDLFDKRWRLYEEWMAVIYDVMRGIKPGIVSNRFLSATHHAELLFGPEVYAYLMEAHEDLIRLDAAKDMAKGGTQPELERMDALFQKVCQFPAKIKPLILRHMLMHQKAPRF